MEKRYVELRAIEGRILQGVALPYGEIGQGPYGAERFEPRAFSPLPADVILNVQHDRGRPIARTGGGLYLDDTPKALSIRAVLPATRESDDTLALVRAGVLRGLSIEFKALEERRVNDVRVVAKALLSAIGVVDSGAYPGAAVEARARLDSVLRGVIPSNTSLQCRCHRGTGACTTVRFSPEVWDESLESNKEVLAITSEFSSALASRSRGGLVLRKTDAGLEFEVTPAATDAARELLEQAAEVSLLGRPVFNAPLEFEERLIDGRLIAFYRLANLRAILLGPSDAVEGWPPVLIDRLTEGRQEERRRIWF